MSTMTEPTIDQWNPQDGIMPPQEGEEATTNAAAGELNTSAADQLSQQVNSLEIEENGAVGGDPARPADGDETLTPADISLMRKILHTKLLQPKSVNLEVIRADPNSPLHSAKTFEELNLPEPLLKGIYAMGFQAPSRIQETALPILLSGQNLIAQSQSGTGKTAAFLLASLYRVDVNLHHPQVLILSPTYELAIQTGKVAEKMAEYCSPKINFIYAVRGTDIDRGHKLTEQVIMGTPGKVMDWCVKYRFFDPKLIRVFVLDEADVMIDTQGHRNQSIRIQKQLSPNCQIMFFSATYDEPVMEFGKMIVPRHNLIRLKKEEESLDNINQYYVECPSEQAKYIALANLFGTISMGQAFIFCATKKSASWLSEKLRKDGHAVGLISGDLTVEERARSLERFRDGQERVLIATNVMARGIDVDQVTVVVNYDLPTNNDTKDIDYETYLHRIGRTGRFGKFGLAINFVDSQRTLGMIRCIESRFGKPIKKLDAEDIEEIEKINQD